MTNENNSDKPAADPQGQAPRQPPPIPSAPTQGEIGPDSDNGANNQQETARELAREFRWVEGAQLAVNGVLAIVGIIALCIYGGQLGVMHGQLEEIKKQYPQLQKSADAARDGVNQAQAGSRLDQRAWVSMVETAGKPEVNQPFIVTVRARNTGKTFAEDFSGTVIHDPLMGKDTIPDFEKRERAAGKNFDSIAILPPSTDYIAPISATKAGEKLSQTGMDLITSGQMVIYVYGRLDYKDVFDCPHWTTFCSKLSSDLKQWTACKWHNAADKNTCQQK